MKRKSSSGKCEDNNSLSFYQKMLKPNNKPIPKTDFSNKIKMLTNDPKKPGIYYTDNVEEFKKKYPNATKLGEKQTQLSTSTESPYEQSKSSKAA